MGEREAGAALRGHQAPDHESSGVREEDFSLESLDMLRVIGTGTFARVCLCQVRRWQPSIEHNHIVFQDKGTSNYYALKILTMSQVIKLKQVEHVINERDILRQALEQRTKLWVILLEIYFREVSHPFIVSLLWSYKDSHCLYMLFPYICGGELFSHLRNTQQS